MEEIKEKARKLLMDVKWCIEDFISFLAYLIKGDKPK